MISLSNVKIDVAERTVFERVNCEFPAGKITAIRKTGVLDGSSTLLKCCAGIVLPAAGEVRWNDRLLQTMTDSERLSGVSYCYESGGLISLFSIYNNIAMPLIYHRIHSKQEAHERIYAVARELDIEGLLQLEPHQLNDVQTRLVNLMRALVLNAQVILTDELQTGMSMSILNTVVDVLRRRTEKNCAIVMVTTSGDDDSFADQHMQIANKSLEQIR